MHIAIIGAGAAGCFAAANIPRQRGVKVVVFEKTSKALQKVKVSGGGRCNVTHSCFEVPELVERYPRGKSLLKRSLYQFRPGDAIEWFGTRGVKLKTEPDGRMFPVTDDSQTIIDCIWQQMMDNDVQVRYNKSLDRIVNADEGFVLHFADGTQYAADRVLVSCGGYPKPEQYKWLTELGHSIQNPVPSLFTFNIPKHPLTELMGVSAALVTVKIQGTKIVEQGPILVTHWGLSGPVVLRASAWGARDLALKNYNFNVQVNWLNDVSEQDLRATITQLRRERGKHQVFLKNPFDLPRRLWEYILQQCGIGEELKWGDLPAAQQNKLVEKLVRDMYEVKGKTTFKEEFVTCGGISLSEIDAQTMQSKLIPGLYFAGEILDVDGITGGFNFQHAWSSGYIAAQSIVK